jgi:hypothetical protein
MYRVRLVTTNGNKTIYSMTYRESFMKKILFVLMLGLAGCATPLQSNQVLINFVSVPPGAMIYDGPYALGLAPQERLYSWPTPNNPQTRPVTAVWTSGAQATSTFNVVLGTNQTATFSRPRNAPGLDKDLMFAERLRQANAVSSAEVAAAFSDAIRSFTTSRQPPPSVTTNCRRIGDSVTCVSQ